jgi:hypothetical protein
MKCSVRNLIGGTQILENPTLKEFEFWMDNDADDDKFSAKQVDMYDKVDLWVPEILGDRVEEFYAKLGEVELTKNEKSLLYNNLVKGYIETE